MVEHFWSAIPGYFTFPEFYTWLAQTTASGGGWNPPYDTACRIVEVGVYTGQSAAYLGVEILRHQSETTIDLVDVSLTRAKEYLRPLESTGVLRHWHEGDSVDVSKSYEVGSVDAVFIDADHAYASVARDIDAWLPKVRKGGIISGHDYCLEFSGVIQAVTERFDRVEVWRGRKGMGDQRMIDTGNYFPCWSVRV